MTNKIEEIVKEFDANCKAKGHAWAKSSIFPGTEYCQACGTTRVVVRVGITEGEM